jgi:hypothetical protein
MYHRALLIRVSGGNHNLVTSRRRSRDRNLRVTLWGSCGRPATRSPFHVSPPDKATPPTATNRKKPGVAFWATVVLAVVLLYVASFGPACWISSRTNAGAAAVSTVYRPLTWGKSKSERIADAIDWYSGFGSADGWAWVELEVANNTIWQWQLQPTSSTMGMM